jgi:hypothetical protein
MAQKFRSTREFQITGLHIDARTICSDPMQIAGPTKKRKPASPIFDRWFSLMKHPAH